MLEEKDVEKGQKKLEIVQKVREISDEADWTVLQVICQEIVATYVAQGKDSPASTKLIELMTQEVEHRYKDEPETKELLLSAIPTRQSVDKWKKRKTWEETVWSRIRDTGLFSREKRAQIINSLFKNSMEGNTQAAKLWLTMSGDYVDKSEVKSDETVDKFREINQVLHKKEDKIS